MKICLKLFLLLLCLLGGFPATVDAASPALIVVLLPGTSLKDWRTADAPNLHRLMQTGSLAVMNTRTAHTPGEQGRETPQSALLTFGAGARAAGANTLGDFVPAAADAPGMPISAGTLFERRTGIEPRSNQSVCPGWPAVFQANRRPGYDLRLGSLADTLTAHGVIAAAGGGPNADWVAVGNSGAVRRLPKLQAAPGQCLIWDAGPNLAASDAVLGMAAAQIAGGRGRLLVISPYADDADYQRNQRLTPVLLWGTGVPAGLLYSSSTRRAGLVTNTDFAPAVAEYFGIRRMDFDPLPFGFAWSAQAAPENERFAELLNSQAVQQAQGMMLLPYLAAALGLWILAVTLVPQQRSRTKLWSLAPMIALTAALFAVSALSFWAVLLGMFALAAGLARFFGAKRTLTILTGGAALALTVDMLTGNQWMQRSLLGYSAIEGARYYGLGNEAMGLLLGAALTAAAQLWPGDGRMRLALIGLLAIIVLLLGSAGAKAGGVLVSLAVFGTFLYTCTGRPWTPRTVASLGAVVVAGMTVAALGDAFLLHKAHSHIGQAVQRIAYGGPGEALDIMRRKLAVEGRLATHSAWALLLWSGMLCTGLLWKRTPPMMLTETALRLAGVVGVLTCLLLNDAGVVAAAIFVTMLWSVAATQKQNLPATNLTAAGRQK